MSADLSIKILFSKYLYRKSRNRRVLSCVQILQPYKHVAGWNPRRQYIPYYNSSI